MIPCLASAPRADDKEDFARLLEVASSAVQDLSCEFEGTWTFPQGLGDEELGEGGLYEAFAGTFLYREDGALRIDTFRKSNTNQLMRSTTAVLGGRASFNTRAEEAPGGRVWVEAATAHVADTTGSYGRIFCLPLLRGYLADPERRMRLVGQEAVDGHLCEVVEFSHDRVPDMTAEIASVERFWIDLGRGGNALRREYYAGRKNLSKRMHSITLTSYDAGEGRTAWVPVGGAFDGFGREGPNRESIYDDEPTYSELVTVLAGSVRVNTGLGDDRFTVKYKDGTFVTDRLKQSQYEFRQARPPREVPLSRAEAEQQLKEQLADADRQRDELRATSAARSGPGWSYWLPLGTSLAALVAVVALIGRRIWSRL